MSLGIIVPLVVFSVIAVIGVLGYLIDKTAD